MLRIMDTGNDPKTSEPPELGRPESAEESDAPTAVVGPSGGSDESEVRVAGRGGIWWARVLGRAGGSRAPSAPLLQLGFRREGAESPTLESLVAGRVLDDVPDDVLEAALARAGEYPRPARKVPFFEDADGARGT